MFSYEVPTVLLMIKKKHTCCDMYVVSGVSDLSTSWISRAQLCVLVHSEIAAIFFCSLLGCLSKGSSIKLLVVRPDIFILWFTDIFAPYPMSGFGIKIKIKFQ